MHKFLPKTKNNPQGFTLVELLVVISIIAILSVVGMAVFTGVQKNARDARRRADVEAISKALETNYNDQTGKYLTVTEGMFAGKGIPTPPNGGSYIGVPSAEGSSYEVCADLEENGFGNATAPQKDFCLKNQR